MDLKTEFLDYKGLSRNWGVVKKPTEKSYIPPEPSDSPLLVIYAENLGSIPPNTGLLIIRMVLSARK